MDDDDRELQMLLREHAERMTADLTDAPAAYEGVLRRTRARRGRRTAIVGGLAAAAAVTGVLVVASITGEQVSVRTPATSPTPSSVIASTTVVTTVATTVPSTVATTLPSTVVTTVPAAPAPQPTEPAMTASPASTTTYEGSGGSITVRLSGGVVTLARDPSPAPGYTSRIDDNGPDRVRVRFEGSDARTEIRVDVDGDRLVHEIIED